MLIGIMIRAKIGKDEIIRLCLDIFSPVWRKGLEKAIQSIDDKQQIPLPEKYMSFPIGDADLVTALRRQVLVIRESLTFFKEWPRMVANVEFLLRWQGIIAPEKIDWVQSYLQLFHTYIQLGVSFGDMNVLKFSILKSKKTSRAKAHFPLP